MKKWVGIRHMDEELERNEVREAILASENAGDSATLGWRRKMRA